MKNIGVFRKITRFFFFAKQQDIFWAEITKYFFHKISIFYHIFFKINIYFSLNNEV